MGRVGLFEGWDDIDPGRPRARTVRQLARELEADYGRLQLEASTWGLHSRVERIATRSLGLRPADPRRMRIVGRDAAR